MDEGKQFYIMEINAEGTLTLHHCRVDGPRTGCANICTTTANERDESICQYINSAAPGRRYQRVIFGLSTHSVSQLGDMLLQLNKRLLVLLVALLIVLLQVTVSAHSAATQLPKCVR